MRKAYTPREVPSLTEDVLALVAQRTESITIERKCCQEKYVSGRFVSMAMVAGSYPSDTRFHYILTTTLNDPDTQFPQHPDYISREANDPVALETGLVKALASKSTFVIIEPSRETTQTKIFYKPDHF